MKINNTQGGLITQVVLITVAIVAIKYYYEFDVLEYLKTPEAQKVIQPVWNAIKAFYDWVDTLVRGWAQK